MDCACAVPAPTTDAAIVGRAALFDALPEVAGIRFLLAEKNSELGPPSETIAPCADASTPSAPQKSAGASLAPPNSVLARPQLSAARHFKYYRTMHPNILRGIPATTKTARPVFLSSVAVAAVVSGGNVELGRQGGGAAAAENWNLRRAPRLPRPALSARPGGALQRRLAARLMAA
jgi:hypothetical protein